MAKSRSKTQGKMITVAPYSEPQANTTIQQTGQPRTDHSARTVNGGAGEGGRRRTRGGPDARRER